MIDANRSSSVPCASSITGKAYFATPPMRGAPNWFSLESSQAGFGFGSTAEFGGGSFGFFSTSHHSTRTLDVSGHLPAYGLQKPSSRVFFVNSSLNAATPFSFFSPSPVEKSGVVRHHTVPPWSVFLWGRGRTSSVILVTMPSAPSDTR